MTFTSKYLSLAISFQRISCSRHVGLLCVYYFLQPVIVCGVVSCDWRGEGEGEGIIPIKPVNVASPVVPMVMDLVALPCLPHSRSQ